MTNLNSPSGRVIRSVCEQSNSTSSFWSRTVHGSSYTQVKAIFKTRNCLPMNSSWGRCLKIFWDKLNSQECSKNAWISGYISYSSHLILVDKVVQNFTGTSEILLLLKSRYSSSVKAAKLIEGWSQIWFLDKSRIRRCRLYSIRQSMYCNDSFVKVRHI
jgi:hypothetical protein